MMDIKKILENAPSGATHCTDIVPSMNLYAKVEHLGGFYVSLSNRWEAYPIYAGIHLLDDLREIVKLQAERDALALEVDEANDRNAKLIEERDALAVQARELARVLDEINSKRRAERDALAAQVDLLRALFDKARSSHLNSDFNQAFSKLKVAFDATPEQCVAEIRAEAGVAGLKHGVMLASEMNVKPDSVLLQCWCDGYAATVRQGGVE